MNREDERDMTTGEISLADMPATINQRRLVLFSSVLLFSILGLMAPIAAKPLARINSFIPTIEGIMFVNDLITATLLLAQFSAVRTHVVLFLASGYLFTALMIVPHALTFPGAFSPTGLLGAGLQTTGWLYYFWHWGTALTLLGYSLLRVAAHGRNTRLDSAKSPILWAIVIVICLVSTLTIFATIGEPFLPILFSDTVTGIGSRPFTIDAFTIGGYVPIFFAAASFAVLWPRCYSVLDYSIILVIFAFISELLANFVFSAPRFTLGFYGGRLFSFATSIFVLSFLLSQMTNIYFRLARSNLLLESERRNKLMNIDAVTASIAHEVKQPLTAISANLSAALSLLQMSPPDINEAKASLNDADKDVKRADDVLNGIRSLFVARDQPRQLVSMNEIVLEIIQLSSAETRARGVAVSQELTFDLPLITGHRNQLHEVVLNLVNNALEAMDNATVKNRKLVLITRRFDGNAVVVAVKDSGPGIDAKQLDSIFDVFVTTKSKGMGLGLAICRAIIARHGGQLAAYSDGKSGALFQFVLPVEPRDVPTA